MSEKNQDAFLVPTESEKGRFTTFLNLLGNDRIIFSGIFGAGKTTFLKEYFCSADNKYTAVHIYPTNYSVTRNEDIFELIKYDLLYELLKHQPYLDKLEATSLEAVAFLKTADTAKVLQPFVEHIPKVGKLISSITGSLVKLYDLIERKKADIKVDDAERISDYIKRFENKKGSIYENDVYTQLINELVSRLKEQSGKSVILIVDDLDRIDPEHVFRILNVFAVHFNVNDLDDSENKFGLDTILLSCDINNLQSIFKAKYGQYVDFNGYIDKFYSRDVYHFNNRKFVISAIDKVLASIQVNEKYKEINFFVKGHLEYSMLHYILSSMVLSNTINLRTLKKLFSSKYDFSPYQLYFGTRSLYYWQIQGVAVFDFLLTLFGNGQTLIEKLERTDFASLNQKELTDLHYDLPSLYMTLIGIKNHKDHEFKPTKENGPIGFKGNISYLIRTRHVGMSQFYFIEFLNGSNEEFRITTEQFKRVVVEAFKELITLKSSSIH